MTLPKTGFVTGQYDKKKHKNINHTFLKSEFQQKIRLTFYSVNEPQIFVDVWPAILKKSLVANMRSQL
jgi:hypothetical protein